MQSTEETVFWISWAHLVARACVCVLPNAAHQLMCRCCFTNLPQSYQSCLLISFIYIPRAALLYIESYRCALRKIPVLPHHSATQGYCKQEKLSLNVHAPHSHSQNDFYPSTRMFVPQKVPNYEYLIENR